MSESTIDRAELIRLLRANLCIPDNTMSDEELLQKTEGTEIRARAEFGLRIQALRNEIKKALPNGLRRLFNW